MKKKSDEQTGAWRFAHEKTEVRIDKKRHLDGGAGHQCAGGPAQPRPFQ